MPPAGPDVPCAEDANVAQGAAHYKTNQLLIFIFWSSDCFYENNIVVPCPVEPYLGAELATNPYGRADCLAILSVPFSILRCLSRRCSQSQCTLANIFI